MSSGTSVNSGSETKGLKPASGLEPTKKSDVQEIDIKR